MHLPTLLLLTLQLLPQASCDEAQDYYNQLYPSDSPRKGLSFPELVRYDNYRCDTHYVTTCDGYILTIFHIYPNENCSIVRPIHILTIAGLYLSGDDYIIPGPGKANAYMCADDGYHVWAGNNRGNKYGRNHTTLNPDRDEEFWNFTFDDMAVKDVPAIIDYILNVSGQPKLNFIGHSQGFTVFLLCCSLLPEYNDKVMYAVGMSAATWLEHTRLLALYLQEALAVVFRNILGEIFRYGGPVQKIAQIVCGTTNTSYPGCTGLIFAMFGFNNFTICYETIAVALSLQPSGTSVNNFLRWGQMMKCPFCSYDYGPEGNLYFYGTLHPPVMDTSKYRVPTQLISSCNDYICDPRDGNTCISRLTGCHNCSMCVLSRKYFCHIDYIYSDEIPCAISPIYLTLFSTGKFICT